MLELLAALAATAGVALWLVRRSWRSPRHDLAWLPAELRSASLVWSEKLFQCRGPVPIVVRIDRAYRSPNGPLVLVEFKRRAVCRAYPGDVVQLSVQRFVLQEAGHLVDRRAYVVVVLPDGRCNCALAVQLEDAQQVERRVERLLALREKGVSPRGPAHPAVCSGCGHRDVCPRIP